VKRSFHRIYNNHDCWTFIRQHQKAKNGRLAFWSLYDHYLGAHNVDTLCAHAENKLTTTVYHGETKRFNWERYTCVHVVQHAVLQGMMEYGYAGIDERTKVRYLLAGIKTSALTPCTANLMATPDIRNSFDRTAGAIKDFINHMKSDSSGRDRDVTVASLLSNVKSGGRNRFTSRKGQSTDGQHVKLDMAVEDQYYSQQEYVGLSAAQKLALKMKRSARPSEKKSWDRRE
jgi:hypothetical protein